MQGKGRRLHGEFPLCAEWGVLPQQPNNFISRWTDCTLRFKEGDALSHSPPILHPAKNDHCYLLAYGLKGSTSLETAFSVTKHFLYITWSVERSVPSTSAPQSSPCTHRKTQGGAGNPESRLQVDNPSSLHSRYNALNVKLNRNRKERHSDQIVSTIT